MMIKKILPKIIKSNTTVIATNTRKWIEKIKIN